MSNDWKSASFSIFFHLGWNLFMLETVLHNNTIIKVLEVMVALYLMNGEQKVMHLLLVWINT